MSWRESRIEIVGQPHPREIIAPDAVSYVLDMEGWYGVEYEDGRMQWLAPVSELALYGLQWQYLKTDEPGDERVSSGVPKGPQEAR